MIYISNLLHDVISNRIRRIQAASPDQGLIEHTHFASSFFHFVVFEWLINNKTIMLFPLKKRSFSSGLIAVEAYFHVVSVICNVFLINLLILFAFFDLLIAGEYSHCVRIKPLCVVFII
jgi:hypothetical protein